ncbi:MAG: SPOR domain-containing protein [Prevotellaceae bacterium]|jgi:hypothetical protein|nr:SPOR domain-containing protein [Prevotellaceae bacterium]
MKKMPIFFLLVVLQGLAYPVAAQTLPEQLHKAEALRLNYQFKEAAAIFSTIAEQSRDSVLRQQAAHQLLLCENGQVMLHYIETPVVTGKKVVPANQFFNYYTTDLSGEWALLPADLLQAKTEDALSPVFIPATDANVLYFASQATGDWDIYMLQRIEGEQWAAPEPVEAINTTFDERFPYVTPDRQTLYFASNGHSGMGGYDLFKSTFNTATRQWNTPENIGFPYSSPFDDWLFVPNIHHTEALFTSSREQKGDSLTVYRIALEVNPTKQQGRSTLQIQQIAKLQPVKNEVQPDEEEIPGDNPNDQYQALHRILQQQQVNETLVQNDLTYIRKMYALVEDPEERGTIQEKITDYENELLQMQASIRQTMERIRKMEAGLLEQGIVPEYTPAVPAASSLTGTPPVVPRSLSFRPAVVFPAKHILPPPLPPSTEEEEKYIFKIGKTSHIFTSPPATAGLVYRIQIGSFSRKLPEKELKGLSPVFIYPVKRLFTHCVGQFGTYKEVSEALPEVKKQGFRDAIIIAMIDGKKTPVKTARGYESKHKPPLQSQSQLQSQPQSLATTAAATATAAVTAATTVTAAAATTATVYHVILGEYPEKLPQELQQAVQQHTAKDIIKNSSKGKTIYIVGPFATSADAEKLQAQLKTKGFEVTIE